MLSDPMFFRHKLVPAAGTLLFTGFAGLLAALACNNSIDEQRGNVGQLCFDDDACDPGLRCVPLPQEGGGTDGGECFLLDAASTEDAPSDVAASDRGEAGNDVGAVLDAALESDAPVTASDAPIDSPEDVLSAEASTDATIE